MLNRMLYNKLIGFLKEEGELTLKYQEDKEIKYETMDNIFNLKKVLDSYDELEPLLKKFFIEKARKEKYEKEK